MVGAVVIRRSDLRDGGDLDALHGVPWEGHAVLDADVICHRGLTHLQQPLPPERGALKHPLHSEELNPQPILLVGFQTPSLGCPPQKEGPELGVVW